MKQARLLALDVILGTLLAWSLVRKCFDGDYLCIVVRVGNISYANFIFTC